MDIIQDITDGYNASYHRSIKMRPIDVKKHNESVVFHNLYGLSGGPGVIPKLKYKVQQKGMRKTIRTSFSL